MAWREREEKRGEGRKKVTRKKCSLSFCARFLSRKKRARQEESERDVQLGSFREREGEIKGRSGLLSVQNLKK